MKKPYDKLSFVSENHWRRWDFRQRMTTGDWKLILLNDDDRITFSGRVRRLVAKNIGYGVVEVYKAPLKENKK